MAVMHPTCQADAAVWDVRPRPRPVCAAPRVWSSPPAVRKGDVLTRLVVMEKDADEKMGTVWSNTSQGEIVLKEVRQASPAARCGLQDCVGWRLTAVNKATPSAAELHALARSTRLSLVLAAPPPILTVVTPSPEPPKQVVLRDRTVASPSDHGLSDSDGSTV
eukprot:Hpha_TRINITY_DN16769_c1_g1::TRINITY_DN16769_c1_g1_i1::g.76948::m.76948